MGSLFEETKPAQQNEQNQPYPLPPGWVWTTLGNVSHVIMGQSPPSSTYNTDGKGLPFFQGKAEFGKMYPVPKKWCTADVAKIAQPGDILISVRAPVGPVNLANQKSIIGRGLAALRPLRGQSNLYLFYYLRFIEKEWEKKATGTTFKAITVKILKEQEIPLAPLLEQRRIVAKIEELFSQLDAAEEGLQRIQRNLKHYRVAVLKAAVEGRLVPTEAELARREGRTYETGEQLLRRILAERCRKWEEQEWTKLVEKAKKKAAQARRKARGLPARMKDIPPEEWQSIPESEYRRYLPKDDRWKQKYKEPIPPDTANLPPLPEGWTWATVEMVTEEVYRYPSFYGMPHLPSGVPVIRGEHILGDGTVSHAWKDYWFVSEEIAGRFPRTLTQENDIVMSVRGTIGKVGLIDSLLAGSQVSPNCIRLSFVRKKDLPYYLLYYFMSPNFQKILSRETNATTITTIKASSLISLLIPLPPLAEQRRIVAEVERRLSVAREAEKAVETNLKRIARLRQAILKRAFEGKLVPQDPNDEPAEKLLEKIKISQRK